MAFFQVWVIKVLFIKKRPENINCLETDSAQQVIKDMQSLTFCSIWLQSQNFEWINMHINSFALIIWHNIFQLKIDAD